MKAASCGLEMPPAVRVVIPTLNEEENLMRLVPLIDRIFRPRGLPWELSS